MKLSQLESYVYWTVHHLDRWIKRDKLDVPEQYNPWNNSTNNSQAPEDGCINIRNMLELHDEIIKQVTSSWSLFIQLSQSGLVLKNNTIFVKVRLLSQMSHIDGMKNR